MYIFVLCIGNVKAHDDTDRERERVWEREKLGEKTRTVIIL